MGINSEIRQCQNCKNSFTIEPEDVVFYEKIRVPAPTFCPDCRFQRRLAYRNERTLYRRKCDLCGHVKVSNFPPDTPFPVYCPSCWWSDKWDAADYPQDYDFSRPFLAQFLELRNRVPQQGSAVSPTTMVNSEYCHMAMDLKNCYMVTHSNNNEDCFYSSALMYVKDSGELLSCQECERCLENVNCHRCYRVYFSLDCEACHDVWFSRNCVNCSNCFGCVNLRNKQYHIFNKSYSREAYSDELKKLDVGSHKLFTTMLEKTGKFWQGFPQKYMHERHTVNVSGDYIYNSKNARNCYDVMYVEDSKYCQYINSKTVSHCYDYTEWGMNAELVYESINCGAGFYNSKFGQQSWDSVRDTAYTSFCIASSNLFGCVSLKHKQHHILNKPYSRGEYEAMLLRIRKHMDGMPYIDKRGRVYRYGEFYPIETSFWGYNETTAQEYFPLTKEEAEREGYAWADIDAGRGTHTPTLKAVSVPDHIEEAPDLIAKEIIECSGCGKPYRITVQELDFYRRERVSLPRLCPECRYKRRFNQRNPYKLYKRRCQCVGAAAKGNLYRNIAKHVHDQSPCPNEFETSYTSDREEIVYCGSCYNEEIA